MSKIFCESVVITWIVLLFTQPFKWLHVVYKRWFAVCFLENLVRKAWISAAGISSRMYEILNSHWLFN